MNALAVESSRVSLAASRLARFRFGLQNAMLVLGRFDGRFDEM